MEKERIELKIVLLDNKKTVKLKCPSCLVWGYLDADQFYGKVSTECTTPGCKFHKGNNLFYTVNWSKYLAEAELLKGVEL